jgi:hypothetical protein
MLLKNGVSHKKDKRKYSERESERERERETVCVGGRANEKL